MKWLGFISVSVALLALLVGCSPELVGGTVDASMKIPYVDRTEKEVNDWFNNLVIIDDTTLGIMGVTNGEAKVLLLDPDSSHKVNGTFYANVLCITQENVFPGHIVKYAAHVVIKVLDNRDLFEAGEIEFALAELSCDGDFNSNTTIESLRPGNSKIVEKAFRDAVDEWLWKDIVTTLKSDTNMEGLEGLTNPAPRNPAKYRGVKYAVIEVKGVRSISFVAE